MSDTWQKLKEWPELYLERLEDAGVVRIVLNRPDKRNSWNAPLVAAFFESLDIVRADRALKVVITKGAGPCFSSGLDLHFLKAVSSGPLLDWDRPNVTIRLAETIRTFPRVMIAQVHGYCLGGALGIMNCHDLVFAADDAQLGMPEILRGSFGQLVTSTLVHGSIPIKKVALIQLVGRNLSGVEADRLGNRLAGAAGRRSGSDGHRPRPRNCLAPSRHARTRQDRGADGSRPDPLAGDSGRHAGGRAHEVRHGPDRRRRQLSQVAKRRPGCGLQAPGCVIGPVPGRRRH